MIRHLRLALLAAVGGALTGSVSWAFLEALDWATRTRLAEPWLVWLLPIAGLVVGSAYFYLGGSAKGGTPAVIEQATTFTHGVPARMAPMIFAGSIAGHVVGASVGREGAALQMAGSVTDSACRVVRLDGEDRQTLVAASLAGGWGAVFGVPVTGIVFTLQVTRHRRWRALAPALVSAAVGRLTVAALGYEFTDRPRLAAPDWTVGLPFKLLVVGLAVGLAARLFVGLIHGIRVVLGRYVLWPPARPVLGGFATLALMGMFGRDYLGLSLPLVDRAFDGADIGVWVPVLKLVFTAVALGTGFVGGEVAPLFAIGATLGAALAPGLHAPRALLAATGLSTAFASAASVAVTGVVLTVELFGWQTLIPAVIVGLAARVAAGHPGLYIVPDKGAHGHGPAHLATARVDPR